jgi:uncharacterized membrane protein YqjE
MTSAERPVSAVLHDIVGNVQDIVHSELRLAKTEITEQAAKARSGAVMVGLGLAMVGFCALFALLAAVYALSLVMPAWAAALLVALFEAVTAAVFLTLGARKLKSVRAAPKTAATLKENAEWARQLTR